jgi:hypothetical protein
MQFKHLLRSLLARFGIGEENGRTLEDRHNYIFTELFSGLPLFGIVLWAVISGLRSGDQIRWLAGMTGMGAGAVIAILASPKKPEYDKFPEYARIASGFVTGFLVSKADRLFDYLAADPSSGRTSPILDPSVQIRLLVGISCFLLSLILIFAVRSRSIQKEQTQDKKPSSSYHSSITPESSATIPQPRSQLKD